MLSNRAAAVRPGLPRQRHRSNASCRHHVLRFQRRRCRLRRRACFLGLRTGPHRVHRPDLEGIQRVVGQARNRIIFGVHTVRPAHRDVYPGVVGAASSLLLPVFVLGDRAATSTRQLPQQFHLPVACECLKT